nr:MAG: ORF1 [Torque teno polar bear virus 27]
MPFYRRRRRWPRRGRFPRRRYLLRHRRRRYWWRRRPWGYRRGKARPVRQTRPSHVRLLKIKGVEFLGELGSVVNFRWDAPTEATDTNKDAGQWQVDIQNVAPVNKEVSYWQKLLPTTDENKNSCSDKFPNRECSYWDFVGGYGQAHFTLFGLIMRTILGFARFNTTLERVRFIKYLGVQFNLQRAPDVNWLFLAEEHRQGHDYEKPLITPMNLLNTPRTVIVKAYKQTHCCRNPRVRRPADPTIYGWQDLEDFLHVPLISYVWSAFNPNNPLGRNDQITKKLKSPLQNNWMRASCGKKISDYCPDWNDRVKYDKTFVEKVDGVQVIKDKRGWWDWSEEKQLKGNAIQCEYGRYAPFLPPQIAADTPQTVWMRYTFLFQIGGQSFGYKKQVWPVLEADTCTPCTQDTHIYPEDKDPWGILKKKTIKRIAGSPEYRKRRALAFLSRLIQHRRRKRKRVTWADEKPPKKSKINLY